MQLMMMVIRDRRNTIRTRARAIELELEMIELAVAFVLSTTFWLVEITMDFDSNLG